MTTGIDFASGVHDVNFTLESNREPITDAGGAIVGYDKGRPVSLHLDVVVDPGSDAGRRVIDLVKSLYGDSAPINRRTVICPL